MAKNKKIVFYLDTTIAGLDKTQMIVDDYQYWFKDDKTTQLFLFSSAGHPSGLKPYLAKKQQTNSQQIVFLEKTVKPEQLHEYYTKKFLLNEWTLYRKHDLFRLYRFFYPLNQDTSFDNQPISIQYDIRYHENRSDEYKSYHPTQTAHIESALDFYKPCKILDAGCGSGAQFFYLKEKLKQLKTHYTGVDASRFQIIKAMDLFNLPYATFQLGDITHLDFSNQAFDLGFTESTLLFCSDPLKGLTELNRVCKNGFFASLYTIQKASPDLKSLKKGPLYLLDTGATWKYYHKITPNVYKIPDYHQTKKIMQSFENIICVENNTDQFFAPLGVKTVNLFLFPKKWYSPEKLSRFSYHPLM